LLEESIQNSENLSEIEKLRQENLLLQAKLFDKSNLLSHTQQKLKKYSHSYKDLKIKYDNLKKKD
jgi:hypothetical protein